MSKNEASEGSSRLRLSFLGSLEVWLDEKPVRFATKKSALLLAYLVTFRDRAHPRETLAGLFWGDVREHSANISLRYALTTLRKVLPSPQGELPYIITTAGSVRFNERAPFQLDTLAIDSALTKAQHEHPLSESSARELALALRLYRGAYLQGFFEEWVIQEQLHWQDRFVEGAMMQAEFYEKRGEHTKTIELCRHALSFSSLHEPLCRTVMRAYALLGDRSAALGQYDTLVPETPTGNGSGSLAGDPVLV